MIDYSNGIEVAEMLKTRFGSSKRAAKELGVAPSTIEKWALGIRNPAKRIRKRAICLIQGDNIAERQARIDKYEGLIRARGYIWA